MTDKPTMSETQEYFSGLIEKEEKQESRSASHPVSVPFYRLYEVCESLDRLEAAEAKLNTVRMETLGWAYADACVMADKGIDIRQVEVPTIIERCKADFEQTNDLPTKGTDMKTIEHIIK